MFDCDKIIGLGNFHYYYFYADASEIINIYDDPACEISKIYEKKSYKIPVPSIKVKGILRITRDLTLTKKNSQIHMILFLDKNTPEKYLYFLPFDAGDVIKEGKYIDLGNNLFSRFGLTIKKTSSTEGLALLTTYYIRSPYENDIDNQKLLKSLLSEKEYTSFMSNRFSCTHVAVECELSDFMVTSYLDQPPVLEYIRFYTDKYSIGIDISTKAEYDNNNCYSLEIDTCVHAKLSNYKVINKYSVSIYTTKWYDEEYYYSSYAKNGVIALACSGDDYINVREQPDGKIILQIRNELARPLLTVYPPSQKWLNTLTKYYTQEDRDRGIDKWCAYDYYLETLYYSIKDHSVNKIPYPYKRYPIFVHDILERDWCKVTIYKSNYMNYDEDMSYGKASRTVHKYNLRKKIVYSHNEVFLMNGYIHASQLHPVSVIRVKDTI